MTKINPDASPSELVVPADGAENITDNNTSHTLSRGIYCGVAGDYDFYVNGSWIEFKGLKAGQVYPIRATGARDASDNSAPASTEIVFLT